MLTDTQCRTTKPKEKLYRLNEFNGLYLKVKPDGKKAWHYRFKLNGKSSMFALGEQPAVMTLDKDIRISVENVRTVSHESGLDVYQCATDLTFAKPNMKNSLPITYRVQKMEDGKGPFYINVHGL